MDTTSFNYRGYYIIVFQFYKDEIDLKKAFQDLFNMYILNAQILVLNKENLEEVLIYTYFPFEENNCERINPIIWNVFKNGNFTKKKIAFPNKLANMNECKIKIAVFNRPPFTIFKTVNNKTTISGIEGNFLTSLSKTLNFTLQIRLMTIENIFKIYGDGQIPSGSKVITDNIANVSIGGFGLISNLRDSVDCTKAYIHANLKFVFQYNKQKTSFQKFLEPFNIGTWCCVIFIFSLGSALIVILKCTKRKTRNFLIGTTDKPLFNMITIFLKNPITRPATRNFARTLTINWMFLSLIISTAYQGTLFQNLRKIEKRIPIYTIKEMVNEGFTFMMPYNAKGLFDLVPEVLERSGYSNENPFSEENRLSQKKAYLMTNFDCNYFSRKYAKQHYRYASSMNIFRFPVGFLVKKSSYLKPEFDYQIDKHLSSGLIKNWISDSEKVFVPIDSKEPFNLTVKELSGAFQICIIFYGFGIFVFFIEMLSVKILFVKKIMNWLTY